MIDVYIETFDKKEKIVVELRQTCEYSFLELTKENLIDLKNVLNNQLLYVDEELRNRGWS